MADTMDSKSIVSNDMWVRLPPPVLCRVETFSTVFLLALGVGVKSLNFFDLEDRDTKISEKSS